MAVAAFGFIGVLVGGLINWIGSRTLDVRRSQLSTRAAVRLLHAAIFQTERLVMQLLERGKWTKGFESLELLGNIWTEQRATIAAGVSDQEWTQAVDAVWAINSIEVAQSVFPEGADIDAGGQRFLEDHLKTLRRALDTLAPVAYKPSRRPRRIWLGVAALGQRVIFAPTPAALSNPDATDE